MLKKFFPSTGKKYREEFPKVGVFERSTKEAKNSPFRRALCTKATICKSLTEMSCYVEVNCFKYWQNLSVRLSQIRCIKALKRTNEQLLLWSTLYLAFYQQKFGRNAVVSNFIRNIGKRLQRDFPKVVVLRVLRKE